MKDQQNFFDGRTIAAIAIVFAMFWLWQSYMARKYPNAFKKPEVVESQPAANTGADPAIVKTDTPSLPSEKSGTPVASAASNQLPEKEQLTRVETPEITFDISSFGMGLKNYQLNKFKDRAGKVISYGPVNILETKLLGRAEQLIFEVTKVNDKQFIGRAKLGEMVVTKVMELGPTPYSINFKVSVVQPDKIFLGLTTYLPQEVTAPISGAFSFLTHAEYQELFVTSKDSSERVHFGKEDVSQSWSNVKMVSIGSQYFTQALVDRSTVMPEAKGRLNRAKNFADLDLNYTSLNKGSAFDISYSAFVGPKYLDLLSATDEGLAKVIDFGFFDWIARHILAMLKWFYLVFGNWGIAIVALTIVVRIFVLPFNVISYRSTKAMQAIQPQLKAIKEKYKNDTQKQQQETMALMRDNKVNPMGGCLPVLLQFPIFIALYSVLGHSIELYQAPFGLWIPDLSLKDPFYVLPVLMGITMYFQQKMMPTPGMDPAQAKVLKFMPLIFSVFMISLPSGLTLYIFVSSAFAVVQQYYFMKYGQTTVS